MKKHVEVYEGKIKIDEDGNATIDKEDIVFDILRYLDGNRVRLTIEVIN